MIDSSVDLEHHPLALTLDLAVPLAMDEIAGRGGPTDAEIADARAFGCELAERADVLLFGRNGPRGVPAAMAAKLARSLAVLAWCPGGVRFAGRRWTR